MKEHFVSVSLALVAAILLGGCEESASLANDDGAQKSSASTRRVCTREYFYNFGGAHQSDGGIFCAEWQDRCVDVDANGEQRDECA